ncbi:MAG: DNA helicase UvrD [Candidatus Aminicenantes bacterium]|nr:DNA helicase UvrD [Candidatus Aminicenantes bacterium]
MKFLADLHVHSRHSRATSRDMDLPVMAIWAKLKGIKVIGTGDFTHPDWLFRIKNLLEPRENGLFVLKNPPANPFPVNLTFEKEDVYFMLSSEVSLIYSKGDRVRKIHVVLLAESLEDVERLNTVLSAKGNLQADGRPTFGMDMRELIEIIQKNAPATAIIPAHIWTPWFSLFGANSGFDSIEECCGDLAEFITALETGLSSDPPMNWRLSSLDKFTLVSNSDAHSPTNIGREANLFDTELSYKAIVDAIKTRKGFLKTIEFFPEEGKYHYDGHRNCGVRLSPREAMKLDNICPKCGKKLTIGVAHRVEELADREEGERPEGAVDYTHLFPLQEIIAKAEGKTKHSKRIMEMFLSAFEAFGGEFKILTEVPTDEIKRLLGERVAKGIENMRKGKVKVEPGYDGVYGIIDPLFEDEEKKNKQQSLF